MADRLPRLWVPPFARHQAGVFTARQALDAGATPAQVRRRRDTGQWTTVAGDALALSGVAQTSWVRAIAATLTWPDAVVSLGSAAALHGLPVPVESCVHVIVPNRRASRGGLASHELRLAREEVTRRGPVQLTTLRRTLFDCIGRLPDDAADALVAWAVTRERLDPAELDRAVRDRPFWWGNVRRRQAVLDAVDGALSVAERRLHDLLHRAGITGWAGDQRLFAGSTVIGRADVLFAAERLVIDVDGYLFHGRDQFQADRTRQNALVAAGYTILRFTWHDLTQQPDAVIAQIRGLLTTLRRRPA